MRKHFHTSTYHILPFCSRATKAAHTAQQEGTEVAIEHVPLGRKHFPLTLLDVGLGEQKTGNCAKSAHVFSSLVIRKGHGRGCLREIEACFQLLCWFRSGSHQGFFRRRYLPEMLSSALSADIFAESFWGSKHTISARRPWKRRDGRG